ncbi:MAG: transcriptional repressor LexA [Clostridiales bacterium]|nr:transcriptional repressor LexA [Clostridiales bacterium]
MNKVQLNEKLNEVYTFTVEYIQNNGYSPTVRDICEKLNIKSTATAYSYLEKLKSKGLLEKSPLKKRAIVPSNKVSGFISVPIVGTIRAGSPIFAVENLEGYCPLPDDFSGNGNEFALRVQGNSMINAGIYENDIIIVNQQNTANNGEIVVALVDDSATVKRFYKKNGKIILHPENDELEDLIYDSVTILGTVKGLIRKF